MADFPKIEWTALEYEERERSRDWFWALGVLVITSTIAAIIFANYFFAALIFLGGGVLSIFALKKPETVHYEIDERGLKVRSNLYRFDSIHAFWVETRSRPALFIRSTRMFLPMIVIPIEPFHAEDIREIMLHKGIPEEEMREHLAEKIMEIFGL